LLGLRLTIQKRQIIHMLTLDSFKLERLSNLIVCQVDIGLLVSYIDVRFFGIRGGSARVKVRQVSARERSADDDSDYHRYYQESYKPRK
jgi:hypothetical protein